MKWNLKILVSVVVLMLGLSQARADIYEWTYDTHGNVVQSSTLCPSGSGVSVVPESRIYNLDLTKAYLFNAYLNEDLLRDCTLTNADLSSARVFNGGLWYCNMTSTNLSNAIFISSGLVNCNLTSANLNNAYFDGSTLSGCNLTSANLINFAFGYDSTLTSVNFTNANLTGAAFWSSTLTNANFTNANLTGAYFNGGPAWLCTLTNSNFTNANLIGAYFNGDALSSATLSGATVAGADFGATGLTASQLYSTASYKIGNLQGVGLEGNDLTGWSFAGQNLTGANLSSSTLASANFNAADLRGATDPNRSETFYGYGASLVNAIDEIGTIQGLNLSGTNLSLTIRDYSGPTPIPIRITGGMTVASGGTLQMVFDGPTWGSTISFAAGIPVALGGNLELGLAPGVDPTNLLGEIFQLFNWTGVSPSGQFAQVVSDLPTRYVWNTSALYSLGGVALTLSPTPINGQWVSSGSGAWSGAANWTGGNVPGAPQDTALFGTALASGTATVTLDTCVSLASLAFSTTGGASYVINPSYLSTLTLSSTAGPATISNASGYNTIAAPVTLESNLSVSASTGSVLTIAGAISESGSSCSLTLSGGSELILSGSNSYTGGTTVDAGTLIVTNNEALADGSNLTVGANATTIFGAAVPQTAAPASAVPEPGALALLAAALWSAGIYHRFSFRPKAFRITPFAGKRSFQYSISQRQRS